MPEKKTSFLSKYYDIIKEGYKSNKTALEIIKDINGDTLSKPSQIYSIANRLGITKGVNQDKYQEKDLKAIELIKSGISCRKTAKILNIDQQSMNIRLKKFYNFEVLPDGKKSLDSSFFNEINMEEKAYWLGFLYADGYIGKNNSIELAVKESDSSHLAKFKKDIQSQHKICRKRINLKDKCYYACRMSFKDKQMSDSLKKLGCINEKTLSIEMPQLDSKEMYRHFIRGFFDGDGHIEHRRNYVGVEFSCASISFCRSIEAYAADILKIRMIILKDNRSKNYEVKTTSRVEAFSFLKHMYNNSKIYLDRKYNQYLNICRSESILPETLNDEDGIKRGWRNVD